MTEFDRFLVEVNIYLANNFKIYQIKPKQVANAVNSTQYYGKTIVKMIAEIYETFQKAIAEHATVDNRLNTLRRDFETEATKIKQKLVNLGEAFAILASEATRASANSTLA